MAVGSSTRLGLTLWPLGSDAFNRSQLQTSHQNLELLVVGHLQDTTRPTAGAAYKGFLFLDTNTSPGVLSYCDGSAWISLTEFGNAVTVAVGDAAANGAATTLSRSDHSHGLPAFGSAIALDGTTLANGSEVTFSRADHSHSIADDSITADMLAPGAVESAGLGDDAINTANVVDGAITNAKLSTDAVDSAKLADNAVNSEHYVNGSIDREHLAADVIDGTKIDNDAINSEHYVNGSIDNAHIADNAIGSEHYADGSILNAHIGDNQVNSEHYADSSIDTAHIGSKQVTAAKIADNTITQSQIAAGGVGTAELADEIYINAGNRYTDNIGDMNLPNAVISAAWLKSTSTAGVDAYCRTTDTGSVVSGYETFFNAKIENNATSGGAHRSYWRWAGPNSRFEIQDAYATLGSDRRLKNEITPANVDSIAEDVFDMELVSHGWKDGRNWNHCNVIAQDAPDWMSWLDPTDDRLEGGVHMIAPTDAILPAIAAIQNLNDRLKAAGI
jgi:hypothetical protein